MEGENLLDEALTGSARTSGERNGRAVLSAWLASGKPMDQYSKEAGVSYWALRRWRLEFGESLGLKIRRRPGAVGKRAKKSTGSQTDKNAPSKLAPIKITPAVAVHAPMVEIRLRGDRAVLVDASVDTQWLSRLLVAVERAA